MPNVRDEYDGSHRIPPEVMRDRLLYLAGEGRVITRGAMEAIDLLGLRQDVGVIHRGLTILHRDRGDELRQVRRYLTPRSWVGRFFARLAYLMG
jgi:hypothetical protein